MSSTCATTWTIGVACRGCAHHRAKNGSCDSAGRTCPARRHGAHPNLFYYSGRLVLSGSIHGADCRYNRGRSDGCCYSLSASNFATDAALKRMIAVCLHDPDVDDDDTAIDTPITSVSNCCQSCRLLGCSPLDDDDDGSHLDVGFDAHDCCDSSSRCRLLGG